MSVYPSAGIVSLSFSTAVIGFLFAGLIITFRFDKDLMLSFFLDIILFSLQACKSKSFSSLQISPRPPGPVHQLFKNSLFSSFTREAALVILTQHQLKLISAQMGGK